MAQQNPPHPKAVAAQLERILSSSDFNASQRLKNFLRFVVTETLKGNAGQIKAYTIAVTVFGRTHSFDPQTDPVVRIEAGKLRSKLEHYYFRRDGKEPVRINIPKGGYIPTFEAILPEKSRGPEIVPEADEAEAPVADAPARPRLADEAEPRLPRALSGDYPAASIAVLPFADLSREERMASFIDGLADEISVGLTRFPDLLVASSYAARQFREAPNTPIGELAGALGVGFILHGSVQAEGEAVRVCASLTHAGTGANIWARRFDGNRGAASLFAIQEEISQKVVAQLGDGFGPIHRVLMQAQLADPPGQITPYAGTFSYQRWVACLDPALFLEAKTTLEQAAERFPDSPGILARLAAVYASDYQLGLNTVPEALNRALEAAKKAQRLDINCQGAFWSEALAHYLRRDKDQFRRTIEQVLPLNPTHPFMNISVGLLLGLSGQISRALDLIGKAVRLSPYSPRWHHIIPFMDYYLREDFEPALEEALQINTPTCFWDPLLRTAAYGQLGRREEARAAYAELLRVQPAFVERRERLLQALFLSEQIRKKVLGGLKAAGLFRGVAY